ncbi:MAG: type II secretion system F family protein [Acidimicrobiales bacterium]
MSQGVVFAMLFVGAGLSLMVAGWLYRIRERDRQLAQILDLPFGERDVQVEALSETRSPLVAGTIGFAGKMVTQFDQKGSLKASLERARIPMKPGEFVTITVCGSVALAALLYGLTTSLVFALIGLAMGPLGGLMAIRYRITARRRKFEAQLPDALGLIASSLAAGHTFLRAIQMMCEESEPPLSEEFARVVNETRLGDPLVDALSRMAARLEIRDLDWVVQAIRIQQQVGGKLADLLHTLSDFIRARDEVRREVKVLTAEGRISAYILTAMAPFMLFAIRVLNPEYIDPLLHGWGLVVLGVTGAFVATGAAIIFKMTKIEV